MERIKKNSSFLIVIFISYLCLSPTPIVESGLMRFIPTLALMFVCFFGICGFKTGRNARMGTIVSLFLVYIIFSALIHPSIEGNKIMTLLKSSYWCWVYMVAYSLFTYKNSNDKRRDLVIIIATVLFSISFNYSHVYRAFNFELIGDNAVFFPLMMLPWIACMSNTTKRWMMVAIIAICAITALKRSGIIIISVSTTVLFYGDFIYRKRLNVKKILAALLVVTGIFLIFRYKADSITDVNQRFDMLQEDGGNGRDLIYEDVIDRYSKSDFISKTFGRGFDTVKGKDTNMALSAHNDFLEVLYDFGAIGFVFYILIHFSLIKWTFRLFRACSQLAFPVLISYACFIVMSLVSHLILYPTYFGLLVSFWAYAESKDRELQYS
ncbi:O-antigen ligase family protein [Parabacteroides distasonis]|nr:O-antigen ligase family protein [Parabacteroides distasonis]